jgi:PAS domain S-box-containing protein
MAFTTRKECVWPDVLVQRLKLVAQIFANALARKDTDQALLESEARLSLAASAASIGLWSLDLASNQFWLTPRSREFFNFMPEELVIWKKFMELIHPEDRELVQHHLHEVIQSGKEGRVEFRVPQTDGGVCWFMAQGRLQQATPSAPRHVMGVIMDITERKLAEVAARVRQERLAAAVEIAALGFYELHGVAGQEIFDGLIRSILGLPDGTVPSAREFWVAHLHPEERERILDFSRQVFAGTLNNASAEYRYLHPQRGVVWLRQISRVLERDSQGRMVRLMGVIQDITEQKLAVDKPTPPRRLLKA